MFVQSLAAGLTGIRRRPGLVGLIYGMNLVLALVLAVPVFVALRDVVGPTGFGADLAAGFDAVLWADILEQAGPLLGAAGLQLLWMIPLYLLWRAAAAVGLIHALRGDRIRSFWQGVGRYTGRALMLAFWYLVLVVALVAAVVGLVLIGNVLWPGEVGIFWINFILAPTLMVSGLAVLDLMHDFARIALVVEEQPVLKAAGTGLRWPFRHGLASRVYLAWFVPAALLLVLPSVLEAGVTGAAGLTIAGLFLLQQALLLLRAAVTVGWIGSEVALYETTWFLEAPLIAGAEVEADAPAVPESIDVEPGRLPMA